jgi:hypothetical protein
VSDQQNKKSSATSATVEAAPTYRLNAQWAGLWKVFAGVGAVGLAGSAAGYSSNPTRFAYSWLFGFLVALTIAIGAMMWVLIQYLTSAGWSVTVRRTAEFFGSGTVVFLALLVPLILTMNTTFAGWLHVGAHHEGGAEAPHAAVSTGESAMLAQVEHTDSAHPAPSHATPTVADHAAPAPAGHGPVLGHAAHATVREDPEELLEQEIMSRKTWWLNRNFFIARSVFYVLVWFALGSWLLRRSILQDTSKDVKLTAGTASMAPVATIFLAFTLTGGAFDWIMSLEPSWYSTIFGVNFFASSFVAIHAVLILTLMSMRSSGMLVKEVTVEHFHDLGKMQFGFLVFWAYISFSQFMLIWYAGIPEETTWYHRRWDVGPWAPVGLALVGLHFVVPFFLIISRNFKRKLGWLKLGAGIILTMHVVEIYWFVMPNLPKQEDFAFSWIDAACLLGAVGAYLAVVFRNMASHSLIPVGDPRLSRALKFQNA